MVSTNTNRFRRGRAVLIGFVSMILVGAGLVVSAPAATAATSECNTSANLAAGTLYKIAPYDVDPGTFNCFLSSTEGTVTAVQSLQRTLNTCYGAGLTVTGEYGPATTNAVEDAQRAAGVIVTGRYGPATKDAIKFRTYRESSGAFVGCQTL